MGMTYQEYWDGDCPMAKSFREMDDLNRERENYSLWLQGVYIYEALLDASPVFNALSKKRQPYPYRSSPIPMTEAAERRKREDENRKKLINGKEAMKAMAASINKKFKEKETEKVSQNNGSGKSNGTIGA